MRLPKALSQVCRLLKQITRGRFASMQSNLSESGRTNLPGDTSYTFQTRSYPGSRNRHYLVHTPNGQTDDQPRPLVLVLHGCQQNNHDIEKISGFNELADRHGFLVAYPYITSYSGMRLKNCWGWWLDKEIHAGAGEVEDLWQIIEEIKQHYAVDEKRIHVTGLSSGAGMAVAMLVAHGDKIASGAAVAGVPYAEKTDAVRHALNSDPINRPVGEIVAAMQLALPEKQSAIPLQIIHSLNDETVDVHSALILRDSWGQVFDINTQEAYKTNLGSTGSTEWQHSHYCENNDKSVIETLFLKGPGHGWYGGNPGDYSFPDAPDTAAFIWEFFASHQLHD